MEERGAGPDCVQGTEKFFFDPRSCAIGLSSLSTNAVVLFRGHTM